MPLLFTAGVLTLLLFAPFLAGNRAEPQAADDFLNPALTELAAQWTDEEFPGDPSQYRLRLDDDVTRRIAYGEEIFINYCAGCHGTKADGNGAAALMLVPRPRNFRYGVDPLSPPLFKFRSTASGEAPLRSDLEATIRNGLPGSSMPDHRLVDPSDVASVSAYILWHAQTSEFRQAIQLAYEDEEPDLEDAEEVADFRDEYIAAEAERVRERYGNPRILEIGARTDSGPDSVDRGKGIYQAQGCHECHGMAGRGDGSSASVLQDSWGFPIDPRDLSTGSFRAGSAPSDLYLRIRGGVSGTPMPSYEDLGNQETWDLVNFILSLSEEAPQ